MVEEDPDVEVITKTEYIYEDTKCITGVEPKVPMGRDIQVDHAPRGT